MFTGLVQRTGRLRRISRGRGLVLEIEADRPWETPLERGESVAVDGACLTVVGVLGARFTVDVLDETQKRTRLASLLPGAKVNLERALRVGDALGGHLVQGHVDGVGTVRERTARGRDFHLRIGCGRVLAAQSVLKGSVAVDGVSLTISAIGDDFVGVDVIPTTARETTLGGLRVGDKVHLEGDVAGKYLARFCEAAGVPPAAKGLSEDDFVRAGFCD